MYFSVIFLVICVELFAELAQLCKIHHFKIVLSYLY